MGTNPTLQFWKGESTLANIEEKVENLVSKTINDLGYELYDVEYVKEGKDYFLRIYIDSEKGIDLNDCEKVSNVITELFFRSFLSRCRKNLKKGQTFKR